MIPHAIFGRHLCRTRLSVFLLVVGLLLTCGLNARSQANSPPSNDLPNPYKKVVPNWEQLPNGRKMGATADVTIGPDGNIWTYERCGGSTCGNSPDVPPILEFDPSGKLVKAFGAGLFLFPHSITLDDAGNVWVTDGIGGRAVTDDVGKHGKGHQVFKFSPDGKVLMVLGKAGVPGDGPDTFNRPSAVAIAPNGDIFVADGHASPPGSVVNARIVKFSKNGKFIKAWGMLGSAPGEFDGPHALAFDSTGRLFVADRSNNRIQIFDQNGKLLAEWRQFGRPSGMFIDKKDDAMYVTDSESTDEKGYGYNPGVKRGIRIGSAKDGKVTAFIPDTTNPVPAGGATSGAEGVAADGQGNIYAAENTNQDIKKFSKD